MLAPIISGSLSKGDDMENYVASYSAYGIVRCVAHFYQINMDEQIPFHKFVYE